MEDELIIEDDPVEIADLRLMVRAMILDMKQTKRVQAVMAILSCDEVTAIKRIISACRKEDILKELSSDVVPKELREGVRAPAKAGGKRDGVGQRKRSASPGPPASAKTGDGKGRRRPGPQNPPEQGRVVKAKQLEGRNTTPKSKLPANKAGGAKGQPRKDAGTFKRGVMRTK